MTRGKKKTNNTSIKKHILKKKTRGMRRGKQECMEGRDVREKEQLVTREEDEMMR